MVLPIQVVLSIGHLIRALLMVIIINYELSIVNYVPKEHQVVIAAGFHLFPFRTEKLSLLAPMVLQCNAGE